MANKGSKKRKLSTDDDEEDYIPSKKTPVSKHGPNGLRSPSFSFTPQNKPAELYRKDLISAMKLADSEQLQNDDYLLIADTWRQDWEKGVQVPVNDLAILNEPKVKEIREKCKNGDFKIPRKFLHAVQDESYRQGCHELTGMNQLSELVVRYDLDDLDVCWLETVNDEREELSLPLIHEWTMERIMEELENQCHKSMNTIIKSEEGLGIEYDEDVVCDVCRSPDSEDGNEMVFCDNCDICVHQACYGIQTIPEGSYLCRACALGVKPTCLLCPNLKGAMKSTRSGTKWAHVSCSLWIPEVSIGCVEKMEPITKISLIPASRWALVCCLCKERSGACIQCSVRTCKTAFHVTCGFNHGMDMKTILDPAEKDGVKLRAFCPKHTQNGGESGCDSPSSPKSPRSPRSPKSPRKDGSTPRKDLTKEEIANIRAKKLKEIEDDFSGFVDVTEAANTLQVDVDIADVVTVYWKLKRRANFNRPLLMPKTEEADRLEKQQEDSLVARMKMFVHLRQDLERVRNLCYMVNRREKMKRQFLKIQEKVFMAANIYLTDSKLNLSAKEIQKTVKKYKDFNVYLAQNINPLPNLPPTLTACSDLESMTTDDERSEHSGPIYSKRLALRIPSGLDKLDTDPFPSVSVKTEFSDNDGDIEADEPPVLEMEDIGTRRRDFAKGTLIKGDNDAGEDLKSKKPMPDLKPELNRPGRDNLSKSYKKTKTKLLRSKDKRSPTDDEEIVFKSTVVIDKTKVDNNTAVISAKSIEKSVKKKTSCEEECKPNSVEDSKEMRDSKSKDTVCKVKVVCVDNKAKDSDSKILIKDNNTNSKDKITNSPSRDKNTNLTSRVDNSKDKNTSSTSKEKALNSKDRNSNSTSKEKVLNSKDKNSNSTSKEKVLNSKDKNSNSTSKDKSSSSKDKNTTSKNKISTHMSKKQSFKVKSELCGLLSKPNLRIDDVIKDKVQSRILKTRCKLKRLNGLTDRMQPKIEAFFIQNGSSASTRLRYNSRLGLSNVTPVKKACEADSHGLSSKPKGSLSGSKTSLGRTRQSSPLQVKPDPHNQIDEDLQQCSPETRSFRRRIESNYETNDSAKKNLFNPNTMCNVTASDNYSAIPMLISPDCLSLKKSLKNTVNNSRAYRSQSPLSSDSSHNEQDTGTSTPRRVTRSRQLDNDENSRESSSTTSTRSNSKLKLSNTFIKATHFNA
ncbi:hypothetical protein SNE40_020949 [Patella caerulea]|uniref:Jade n=1 Tax=Patella caerulea TaxID=87958 RepID=A0AAN8IZT2_PATCE